MGSFLCFAVPRSGTNGAIELIIFRIVQGIGGAFLFANGAAIITDAFPENERGQALGINMVSILAGSLIGLIAGGILATYNWRLIFLVSVPIGIFGTVWSYAKSKEVGAIRRNQKLDIWGNATFGVGLTLLLVAVTYGLSPYGNAPTGWGDPWVIGCLVGGTALLLGFIFIETKTVDPMFRLDLFKNRQFAASNFAGLLSAISRGGVQTYVDHTPAGHLASPPRLQLRFHAVLVRDLPRPDARGVRHHGADRGAVFRQTRRQAVCDDRDGNLGSQSDRSFASAVQL